MLQAVIFDFDGVLLETSDQLYRGYKKVLATFNINYAEKQFNENYGLKTKEHFNKVLLENDIRISDQELNQLVVDRDKYYQEICEGDLELLPGVRELLDDLMDRGIKLAVASSTSRKNLDHFLTKFGILDRFDLTFAGTEVTTGKPDPEIYLKTSSHLGVEPNYCVGVEDTDIGVRALKNADMKAIAVTLTNRKDYDFSGADLVVRSLEELNWQKIRDMF